MRLPFLQLESDFLAHGAAELAHLARCTAAQAIGHVSLLRAWAVSHAGDDAPPDGFVAGNAAGRRIEAAAQWQGERGALLEALLDAGQVQQEADGMRVLHLDPYVSAWNKNAKAKERMRTARERSTNMRETDRERSSKFGRQMQMQTQKEETTSPDAGKPTPEPLSLEAPAEKPKRQRKEASGPNAELWRSLEAEYQRSMGVKYASGNGGADAASVSWLLANTTPPEAVRRWGNLLEWSKGGYPSVRGFQSLRGHWNEPQVVGSVAGAASPVEDERSRVARESREKWLAEQEAKKAAKGAA